MFHTFKPIKGKTYTESSPFNSKSLSVNISCKNGLTTKQAEYVYSKCKHEEIGHVSKCMSMKMLINLKLICN